MGVPDFSARPSATGYLFQIRYALLIALRAARKKPDAVIRIEGLDDIDVVHGAGSLFVQTKHHEQPRVLSDRDTDLWKTLRIWSTLVQHDPSLLTAVPTTFTLITTATARPGSAVEKLRHPTYADAASSADILTSIAFEGANSANAEAYRAFLALSPPERASLLSLIRLVDGATTNVNLADDIKAELRTSVTGKAALDKLARELEGWWMGRVAVHLSQPSDRIESEEIYREIRDVADSLGPEALPLDSELAHQAVVAIEETLIYVRQLRLCGFGDRIVLLAIRDFLRARSQVAEWVREELLPSKQLTDYYGRLVEEWEQLFAFTADSLSPDASDADLAEAGGELFQALMRASIPIRSTRTEPFIMRGCYHELADTLRVGWHPKFKERLP